MSSGMSSQAPKLLVLPIILMTLSMPSGPVIGAVGSQDPLEQKSADKPRKENFDGKEPQPEPVDLRENPDEEKPLSKAERKKIRDAWTKRLQGAVRVLHTGKAAEVNSVETMILELRDPQALGPMLEVLGREAAPIRLLLDRNLASQDSELAWVALAERLLVEPEADVRRHLVRQVEARQDHPAAKRFFLHVRNAVTSKNAVRAGLGALAAADLNWREQVPELIDRLAPVLFTRSVDWVPTPVSPGPGLMMGSVEGYVIVPVPVVGPGVVAYGQQIVPVGQGLAMGGGSPGVRMQPVVRAGRSPQPNPAVLTALMKLTGEDFGYDTSLWKAWAKESFRVETIPPKRVPTP